MVTATRGPPVDTPPIEVLQGLRMPPFPAPPPGTTIIPFKDFEPSGIRIPIDENGEEVEPDEDLTELDALGVPTVTLRVKHTMDVSERAKRKRKKKAPKVTTAELAKPKTWWEAWEETEFIRRNTYDQNLMPTDRLACAAQDFVAGRSMSMFLGNLWDQFRTYIGLLVNPSNPNQSKQDDEDDEDSVGEDEEIAEVCPPAEESRIIEVDVTGAPLKRLNRKPSSQGDDASSKVWDTGGQELLERFLDDPERSMKIFFSSYFRDKGLLWSPQRCVALPILVHFFLRYLIRCKTFSEPELERPFQRALSVVDLARVQLPTSSKIGQVLPDAFSQGCRTIWGSKRPLWAEGSEQDPVLAQDVDAQERAQAEVFTRVEKECERRKAEEEERRKAEEEERATKRQKREPEFEQELKTAAESGTGGWGESNTTVDADGDQTMGDGGWSSAGDDSVWGAAGTPETGNWGTAGDSAWGKPLFSAWGESDADKKAEADVEDEWRLPEPSLLPLLGPSAFPLTHRTGIVEKSTRKIVAVHPPASGRACKLVKGPSVEAVEDELMRRCARVELEPWPRKDLKSDTDIGKPTILPSSRGKVNIAGIEDVEGHAPLSDTIMVLIEPKSAEVLTSVIGMGLGATWIQLVRADVRSTGKQETFWYMEELFQQIPSYYTDMADDEDI
ncbi:hypothetical protein K488DRAFT_84074 [Vararia minispora EC-137]|uniref:Uncharacterized protein n=1 Tax=Vararia minispora EC-137 TaxID=1314806 RepID=A0ACB8QRH9_9AGAM|nr:hypothetical protein K488DRAFT_84074 [Vararia minispora EC-137]